MVDGAIESTRVPRNPLDVLAQQIVAMCAQEAWPVDQLYDVCRRAYNFASLPRTLFEGTLDMLAGRYPSDEFRNLKARLVWDRVAGTVIARGDARVVAVTSGGTIPERGLYGVFLGEGGPRVGELDEEMVYESRPGETFVLGASTWRIERITPQQVIVSPAPRAGQDALLAWRRRRRPIELGRALGEFNRKIVAMDEERAMRVLRLTISWDELAARNLLAYLAEQKTVTGAVPSDRTIVVERFRDELGDWRVCVLTPFGGLRRTRRGRWASAPRSASGSAQTCTPSGRTMASHCVCRRAGRRADRRATVPDAERTEDLVVRELVARRSSPRTSAKRRAGPAVAATPRRCADAAVADAPARG